MRLIIFCGAHKTASTHFFRCLERAKPLLKRKSIAVISPSAMYDPIEQITNTVLTGTPRDDVQRTLTEELRKLAGGAETLLMFDENLLGGTIPNLLLSEDKLYPWAERRMTRFRSVLPVDSHVFLAMAIRDLSSFLPSAYGECLHHQAFQEFSEFVGETRLADLQWSELVERLLKAADCPVFLWRYEEYPSVARELLAQLLGSQFAHAVNLNRPPERRGLSDRAINKIRRAHELGLPKPKMLQLRRQFPKSMLFPAFQPFDEDELNGFAHLYAQDWKRLSAMENVHTIESSQMPDERDLER